MKYEAVFFDWDGVVAQTTGVKEEAFVELFASYGEEVKQKIEEHLKLNHGISRYEKIKHYYNEFLGEEVSDEKLEEAAGLFAVMTREKLLDADLVEGTRETLEKLKEQNIPAFVVTGTPEEEANDIAQERGLQKYFVKIFGSPATKTYIINRILKEYKLDNKKVLFFGDGLPDYDAAKNCDVDFIGIIREENIFPEDVKVQKEVYIEGF